MPFPLNCRTLRLTLTLAALLCGCEEDAKKESVPVQPSASVAATASAPAPAPTPPPAPPKPREDCPEGSSGLGTNAEPCKASGDSRMLEVKWTGKISDEGPKFSVTNKSQKPVLYGSVAVYFYDKAGKQLQVTHATKSRPMQICSGNIFAGAVKPGEKIFVFFSCVKKSDVPQGTAAIEAEAKGVGFANEAGTQSEFYWSNMDLVPDERPKGGIKAKGKAKK
jgi:hypothetical protein